MITSIWLVLLSNTLTFWLRHALFTGIAGVVNRAGSRLGLLRRIASRGRIPHQLRREVAASALSGAIFVLFMGALTVLAERGHTRIYFDPFAYGGLWFFASIPCMVLLHDAYFYWTHRLRHETRLFWRAHHLHHTFTEPTSWAAFASSPAEALIEAGVLPLIVWTIPIHPAALFFFTSIMTAQSVMLHCGFERSRLARRPWWMGSRAHADHHRGVRGNYGLYTTWWDVAFGTYVPAVEHAGNEAPVAGTQHRSAA